MDFGNLTGQMDKFGGNTPKVETMNNDETKGLANSEIVGKLFANSNQKCNEEEFRKIQECAAMLEKYVDVVPKNGTCAKLNNDDKSRWLDDYFKTLVHGGPQLADGQFYTKDQNRMSNYGIGTDASFTCEELFQFLYRLYKAIAEYKLQTAGMGGAMRHSSLFSCAAMLEKYVDRFPGAKGCISFEGEDAKAWKDTYFPELVEGGPKLPDYSYFHPTAKNYGIGNDGSFSAQELFHFLYRLYKEISENL